MLASKGSKGSGATRGSGPQDPVVDAAHGGGDPAPEPDYAVGAVAVGGVLIMTEPVVGVSSS
jgi:hypothetical protein